MDLYLICAWRCCIFYDRFSSVRKNRTSRALHLPVSERCDDKTRRIPQVLVRVLELRVADVGVALALVLVPPVAQLTEPLERQRAVNLLQHQRGDDVAGVHVDGADGHDLLPVALVQFADEQVDQGVQLQDLCRVVWCVGR